MKIPFFNLFRARDKPQDSVSVAPTFFFGSSGAGKSVTVRSAVQLSTVYACVRVIAETIASLPLNVFESTAEGSVKAVKHPLQKILHDEPNSEMTSFIWRETMLSHLLLWGNAYSQIIRTGRNQVAQLYPLLPDHMEVDRDSDGVLTYTYTTRTGEQVTLRPEDVLHIPGLGFDGVWGTVPSRWKRTPSVWALLLKNMAVNSSPTVRGPAASSRTPTLSRTRSACARAGTQPTAALRTPIVLLSSKRACAMNRFPFPIARRNSWKRGNSR